MPCTHSRTLQLATHGQLAEFHTAILVKFFFCSHIQSADLQIQAIKLSSSTTFTKNIHLLSLKHATALQGVSRLA
jgi:hypothetical protein